MAINQATVPAPGGGLNTKDNVINMQTTDALVFQDCMVEQGCIRRRDGFTPLTESVDDDIRRPQRIDLLPIQLDGINGECMMYLTNWEETVDDETETVSGAVLFDKTIRIYYASPLPLYCYRADYIKIGGTWVYVPEDTASAPFYYKYNADAGRHEFIPLTLTDADPEDSFNKNRLIKVESHAKRLFFLEDNSMRIWYIDQVGAFQGEVNYFDVSWLSKKGSKLIELAEWTRTGADNINTMLVAFSDEGEVFIWEGDDPESADWRLVGQFYIPPLLGNRSVVQVGSDLLVMTEKGLYSADAFTAQTVQAKLVPFSDKIEQTMKQMANKVRMDEWEGSLTFSNDRKEVWWLYGVKRPAETFTDVFRWDYAGEAFPLIQGGRNTGWHMLAGYTFTSQIPGMITEIDLDGYRILSQGQQPVVYLGVHIDTAEDGQPPHWEDVVIAEVELLPYSTTTLSDILSRINNLPPQVGNTGKWDGQLSIMGKDGTATLMTMNNNTIESYTVYQGRYTQSSVGDAAAGERRALVFHLDTETWSEYGDCLVDGEFPKPVFSNIEGLCDFNGELCALFPFSATGTDTGHESCIAAMRIGSIEFNKRMQFSVQQAYFNMENANLKKISFVNLVAVIPTTDTIILVSFYGDFNLQSTVRVQAPMLDPDPLTGKLPASVIHVDCPCNPCTYFSIRLDITSSANSPYMFEWVSTQVFFKEGIV